MNKLLRARLQLTGRTGSIVCLILLSSLAALTYRTAPPSDMNAQARKVSTTKVHFSDYRVLFDRNSAGYPASSGSFVYRDGKLSMVFQKASDGDSGLQASLTESLDLGKTWTQPVPFGPAVVDAKTAFQACHFSGVSAKGTLIISGFFSPSGIQTSGEGINWRPNTALIGCQPRRDREVEWTRYESGTFLGEQFVERGVVTRNGRIVLAIWGSAKKGDNWQCGVLLSDDDGKTWRYRQVGYASDLALRDRAAEPVGYNEQTLFEAHDGMLVSMIRGRQKLAQLTDGRPRENVFLSLDFKRCGRNLVDAGDSEYCRHRGNRSRPCIAGWILAVGGSHSSSCRNDLDSACKPKTVWIASGTQFRFGEDLGDGEAITARS
jgi:hypothetical protein